MKRSMRKVIGWGGLFLCLLSLLMPYGLVFADSTDPVQKLIDSLPDNPVKNLPDQPVEKRDFEFLNRLPEEDRQLLLQSQEKTWLEFLSKLPREDRQALLNASKNQTNSQNQPEQLPNAANTLAYKALKWALGDFLAGGTASLEAPLFNSPNGIVAGKDLRLGFYFYFSALIRGGFGLFSEDGTLLQAFVDLWDATDKALVMRDYINFSRIAQYGSLAPTGFSRIGSSFNTVPLGPLGKFAGWTGVACSAFELVVNMEDAFNQPAYSKKQAEAILGAGQGLGGLLFSGGALVAATTPIGGAVMLVGLGIWAGCTAGKFLLQSETVRNSLKVAGNVVKRAGSAIAEGVESVGRAIGNGAKAVWDGIKSLF